MAVWQLIYMSKMTTGMMDAEFEKILASSRRNNPRHGLTGMLLQGRNLFLQLLEGPRAEVEAAYARIGMDWRHYDLRVLSSGEAPDRSFAEWTMGFAKAEQFTGISGVNDFLHGDDPERWFTASPDSAAALLLNFRELIGRSRPD